MMKESMKHKRESGQDGFSYFDVIIAILVTSVGILAMTGALTANLIRAHGMTNQVFAKQMANSTLESVFAARDIAKTGALDGWDAVGNVGSNPVDGVPKGIFVAGWTPIRERTGTDGVFGTADDACAAGSTCPGETTTNNAVSGYERQIVITDISDASLGTAIRKRRVEVSIRYRVSGLVFQETLSSNIADYR
jgi:Tfp pilus assembly protein PilV